MDESVKSTESLENEFEGELDPRVQVCKIIQMSKYTACNLSNKSSYMYR